MELESATIFNQKNAEQDKEMEREEVNIPDHIDDSAEDEEEDGDVNEKEESSEQSGEDDTSNDHYSSNGTSIGSLRPQSWASFGHSNKRNLSAEQSIPNQNWLEEKYPLQKKRGRPRKIPYSENSLIANTSREHERVRWNKKGTSAFTKFVMKYLKTFTDDPQANQKAFYQRLSRILSTNSGSEEEEYMSIPRNEDGSVLTEIQIGGKLRQLIDSQRKLVLDNADKILDIAKSFTALNWDLTLIIVNVDEAIGRRRDLGVEKTNILGVLKELIGIGVVNGSIDPDLVSSLNDNRERSLEKREDVLPSIGIATEGDELSESVRESSLNPDRKRLRLDSATARSLGCSIAKFREELSVGGSVPNGDSVPPSIQSPQSYLEEALKQSLQTTSKVCESFNKTIIMIQDRYEREQKADGVTGLKNQIKNELKEELGIELGNKFRDDLKLELIQDIRTELKSQLSGEVASLKSEVVREEVSKVLRELMNKL